MLNNIDEVLVSTSVYDSVSKEPFAGYIAISGDSIVEVGKGDVPQKYIDEANQIADYGDGTICAGFGDAHTFFAGYIIDNLGFNLESIKDITELKEVLQRELTGDGGLAVLFGNHLKGDLAKEKGTEALLNKLSIEVPIVLFAPGHETCAMNQKARDEFDFTPEKCHAEALHKIMRIYLNDREFVDRQLRSYMQMLNERGVTSVKEMGFDDFYGFTDVLKDFENKKDLTLRFSFMSQPVTAPVNIEYGKRMQEMFESDFVKFSGYNQMTDGLIIEKQGHLVEPYENSNTVCEKEIDYEMIEKEVLLADENCFRFTLHSEGDGAFHKILDIYEKCVKNADGTLKNRHGITDLELTLPEDQKRMKDMGIFGEIYAQVYSLDTYEGWVSEYQKVIGGRQKRYMDFRGLKDNGVILSGATDLPMLIPDIREAIYYGCGNYGLDEDKQINLDNALTVSEMLDAWTIGSQYAMEREDILGTLESGKRADLVVFDQNLFTVPIKQIRGIKIIRTMVDGQDVYRRK